MKRTPHSISLALAGLALAVPVMDSAHANNLLTNPGFEEAQMSTPGNNFPATVPGWTLVTSVAPCENGHNIVRGGAAYDGGPDNAVEGAQYYDICGAAGYLWQSFTLASASNVNFGASFSRRDTTGGGGSVAIYDATNTTLIVATPPVNVLPHESQELWVQANFEAPNLAAGTYVVRVNIDDTANADAAFVTPVAPVWVGNGTPGSATEAAFENALAQPGASFIAFDEGAAPVRLEFTRSKRITRNVMILGSSAGLTLSGQGFVQMFVVDPGVALKLMHLTLERGYGGTGGAILNRGNLDLQNVRIKDCIAGAHGGAIQNSGSLYAFGSEFAFNRAGINGGAIDNTGRLQLQSCRILSNGAGFRGGGVYNYLGTSEVVNCHLKWNTAGAYGGGMGADGGTVSLIGGRVRGNRSNGTGGGLNLNANARVQSAEISLNTAAGPGGGVNVAGSSANLDDLRLYSNAGSLGGGLATQGGNIIIRRALIQYNRNTSTVNQINHGGGGVYVEAGTPAIFESRISHNRSNYAGGGVMLNDNQSISLVGCIVSHNSAALGQLGSQQGNLGLSYTTIGPGSGPGVWSDGGIVTMAHSTVSGVETAFFGGGITLRRGAAATIENSTISGNTAVDGGGMYLESGFGGSSAVLTNVTVAGNTGYRAGGNFFLAAGPDVSLTLNNSIVANALLGGNCAGKEVTASRYSISSDNLCALMGPGDRNGVNPLLGPLQNNGGPTMTHLPQTGSPAIDGVLGTQAPAYDQTGRVRPAGLGYDIGSVEVGAAGSLVFNLPPASVFDGNDTADDDGDGSPDAQELAAGTDPNSPADFFRLSISPANPLQVNFPTKNGMFYKLYVTQGNAPTPLSQWVSAGQATINGNDGIRSFTIEQMPGVMRRFYRVLAMSTDGPWP